MTQTAGADTVNDPLLDADHTNATPKRHVESAGDIFATFGAATQDSGNVSYGVRTDEGRFFIKTTDPDADVFLGHGARVELLRNAVSVAQSCDHPTLASLLNVIEGPHGPMLIYEWVDGELLGGKRGDPQTAHQRFRRLEREEILFTLDQIFELHVHIAETGLIAVDFYDGCLIYDFSKRRLRVVDLDNYRSGPFQNTMGRMFGSSRFMAPEEFALGQNINQRTNVFTMGRTAAVFLSDSSLDPEPFRGSNAVFDVVLKACQHEPEQRYPSMRDFFDAWRTARSPTLTR
jgi:serine/threonine-protein kinase